MKKRSQVRKYTVNKVAELLPSQTIPENLKMYAEHVQSKNQQLQDQRKQLINQLNRVRQKTQKIAFQMNDNVKDRLDKKEKVVMTSKSRPSTEDVKNMTDLYQYMQNQTNFINRNNEDLDRLAEKVTEIDNGTVYPICDYSELDSIYAELDKKCQEEEVIRDELAADRDERRAFYQNINDNIAQCRIKYEKVEREIAEKEKELDHLTTYFKNRQAQDEEKVKVESNMTAMLEHELLKAQEIVNYNSTKTNELKIKKIEYDGQE